MTQLVQTHEGLLCPRRKVGGNVEQKYMNEHARELAQTSEKWAFELGEAQSFSGIAPVTERSGN